jgi:FixJ family two-component response regulator
MSTYEDGFLVDDDARMREAVGARLGSLGWQSGRFATARGYDASAKPDLPACLILDVDLPDINGLDLQGQIAEDDHPALVFVRGHGDIRSSLCAIKHGAVDFLTKPFGETDLTTAIRTAIDQDRERRLERFTLGCVETTLPLTDNANVMCNRS